MSNKVFIARDGDGRCFIYEHSPHSTPSGYARAVGKFRGFDSITAEILGIPFPKPGEMIEWTPPTGQAATPKPEPPFETLVEITSLAQLKVGDKVVGDKVMLGEGIESSFVLAVTGGLIALSLPGKPSDFDTWWTLDELNEAGYKQIITTPRTLNPVVGQED